MVKKEDTEELSEIKGKRLTQIFEGAHHYSFLGRVSWCERQKLNYGWISLEKHKTPMPLLSNEDGALD
jgi:hypothetical protein